MHERKPRVLVTGGAGYLGSTLVPRLLADGFSVRVLDILRYGGRSLLGVWSHPGFQFLRGDVRDRAMVRASLEDIDAVVHLAAIVGDPACAREPAEARAINLDASIQLLELCRERRHVTRFVFASTCSNYGRMDDPDVLVDESSVLRPLSLYAETKVAFERILIERRDAGQNGAGGGAGRNGAGLDADNDRLCATSLRFATIFGVSPRMRFDLTVNEFTCELILRRHLVVFGEQFWRPYVHVRDAAAAIELTLSAPTDLVRGQVFNVGSSQQNFRKQQIVDLIRRQAPDATVEYVHVDSDPRDYRVSFAKIHDRLSFRTTASVEDGVAEVARLVRQGVLPDTTDACYRN
jgi:nucleoside-diphosphate-sugar epimerase